MKKFYFILTPLLVSLFLFPNIVKAATSEVYFSDNDISYYENINFNNITSTINSYISEHPTYSYYFCRRRNNNNSSINCYLSENIPSFTFSSSGLERYLYFSSFSSVNFTFSDYGSTLSSSVLGSYSPYLYFTFSYDSSIPRYYTTYSSSSRETFIYSNFDLLVTNFDGPLLNIHSNDTSYLFENNTNFPSLYFIYNNGLAVDNTPLLTQFFDISLEKLSLICDFITSSYIYLSIFVIFIIYFTILLLRRLK